jgi:hypothetical protein
MESCFIFCSFTEIVETDLEKKLWRPIEGMKESCGYA